MALRATMGEKPLTACAGSSQPKIEVGSTPQRWKSRVSSAVSATHVLVGNAINWRPLDPTSTHSARPKKAVVVSVVVPVVVTVDVAVVVAVEVGVVVRVDVIEVVGVVVGVEVAVVTPQWLAGSARWALTARFSRSATSAQSFSTFKNPPTVHETDDPTVPTLNACKTALTSSA